MCVSTLARPCSHRAISALGKCPFHVGEALFPAWLANGVPDMTSWFDQLLKPCCAPTMGVRDDDGAKYSLQVAVMVYMPS